MSMVWPAVGRRTAKEHNRTADIAVKGLNVPVANREI